MTSRGCKLLVLLTLVGVARCQSVMMMPKEAYIRENEQKCREFGKEPFFDTDIVVGKPWRIYYSWNMNFGPKCMDMSFRPASEAITNRIYHDMADYLVEQPVWNAATMLVTMGKSHHELLLFADQGPAGRFKAVADISRTALSPRSEPVPLLAFQMKLVRGGKFLVILDCNSGVATLASRFDVAPFHTEVASAAAELNLGPGEMACTGDRNKDENFLIE